MFHSGSSKTPARFSMRYLFISLLFQFGENRRTKERLKGYQTIIETLVRIVLSNSTSQSSSFLLSHSIFKSSSSVWQNCPTFRVISFVIREFIHPQAVSQSTRYVIHLMCVFVRTSCRKKNEREQTGMSKLVRKTRCGLLLWAMTSSRKITSPQPFTDPCTRLLATHLRQGSTVTNIEFMALMATTVCNIWLSVGTERN